MRVVAVLVLVLAVLVVVLLEVEVVVAAVGLGRLLTPSLLVVDGGMGLFHLATDVTQGRNISYKLIVIPLLLLLSYSG